MKNRNIYKIDDYLISFGTGGFLLCFFMFPIFFRFIGKSKYIPAFLFICFLVLAPTAMILVGYYFRSRENKINRLLHLLETILEIDIPDITKETQLLPDEIQIAFAKIQTLGLGFYVWDTELNRVYDRRLLSQYVFVELCPSCGNKIGKSFSMILKEIPRCEYCNNPIEMRYWNELRMKSFELISKNNLERYRLESFAKKEISIPLLIFLFIFFWPLGVFYLLKSQEKKEI